MDSETLVSLALILLYFLFQALSGKKKNKQRKPGPVPTGEPDRTRSPDRPPESLEEALREIREALGTATPEPEPVEPETASPEPVIERPRPLVVPRPPELVKPPVSTPRRELLPHTEFQPVAKDHREAHFLPDLREAAPYPVRTSAAESDPGERTGSLTKRQRTLRSRLKEPRATRDAILLAEILGPPKAKRRR